MIRVAKPYISEKAIDSVSEVLRSGNLVQGKYVDEFEKKLEKYIDTKHAVLVSSGTAALHLSLLALGVKPGDEVIIPAFTYTATANAVEIIGAKPVLVDISLADFCINVSKIESSITSKTKAIMPVHEFGNPANMDEISKISKDYNLKIIEDAACSLGTEFKGKKVGTFGNLGCFSFHPRKAITTGEGGAIITNDKDLAEKVKSLRNHGISFNKNKINFIYAGFNYRMTDFQAALGIEQLNEIDSIIDHRIKVAEYYNESFRSLDWVTIPTVKNSNKAVYQTYQLMIEQNINRDLLIKKLKHKGIESGYGAYAVHMTQHYEKKYNYSHNSFNNSRKSFCEGLALPIGTHVKEKDCHYIVKTIKSINLKDIEKKD